MVQMSNEKWAEHQRTLRMWVSAASGAWVWRAMDSCPIAPVGLAVLVKGHDFAEECYLGHGGRIYTKATDRLVTDGRGWAPMPVDAAP